MGKHAFLLTCLLLIGCIPSAPLLTQTPQTSLALEPTAIPTNTPPPVPTFTATSTATLTPTEAPTSSPAAQEQIAFVSDRDGNREIYVMNADGTGVNRLTNDQANDFYPAWSADGTKIAWEANYEINVMKADGTGVNRLTNDPAYDFSPAWSPDGTKIAFVRNRGGEVDIYMMNADGTGLVRLSSNPASDFDPAWSPDGKKIAFVSYRDGDSEIYVMSVNGTGVGRLTFDPADDSSPAWSPDGTKIAFVKDQDGNSDIYLMNTNGTAIDRLTSDPGGDFDPAWSPDGMKIVFASGRDGNFEIYVMNPDGTGLEQLTNDPADDWAPAWSPASDASYSQAGISDEVLARAAYIAGIEPEELAEFFRNLRDVIVAGDAEALAKMTILPIGSCDGVARPIDTTEELEDRYREILDDDFRALFTDLSLNEGNTDITWYGVGIPGDVWFTSATGQLGIRILRFDGYCVLTESPQAVGDTPSP